MDKALKFTIEQTKRIVLLIGLFLLPGFAMFSQSQSSRDNYTGSWETPASWNPTWALPQTNISGYDIIINGYITAHTSVIFTGTASTLTINDTLVIQGDLILDNNNDLILNENGVLIVRGNLSIGNQTIIHANSYLIITGDFTRSSSDNQGSFNSNDNPVKVFIGGEITPPEITDNNSDYPALNCTATTTATYPNSGCSYGNMTDILNDPIHDFLQSTCTIATPTISANGPTAFCAGGSVTLTSSTGSTYLWSTGATTASINVTVSGNYTVKVIEPGVCQSAVSVATMVTANALPETPTITASGPTALCEGDSVILTSSNAAGYLWSNGAASRSIMVDAAGSYAVKVTDANGCQSSFSEITPIAVNALPIVNAGTDVTIPNGTSTTIDATVTGTGPFSYTWSPSGKLENALIEDPTTVNLATTTIYTLTATSATTLCAHNDAVTITISGGPLTSIPTANPATTCAGAKVQLHAMASGGSGSYTYNWTSVPLGFTSSLANPIANPLVNTTFYVTVSDGFNTVNTQILVMVNALPATPTITADGPATFCDRDTVTLTSSAGTSYLWSGGANTQHIKVTTGGSYSVSVTDASGCQSAASSTMVVLVNANPITPTITSGGSTTFCDGGSVTLTSGSGASYLWSTGATSREIEVMLSGSYSVSVFNASGCQSAFSVATVVTVNALPVTPTISPSGTLAFCTGTSATLTTNAGTHYLWSTGETTASISITDVGSYTVQVTDINGCQSAPSAETVASVSAYPSADAGADQVLESVFETQMNAAWSSGETGAWSLVSGSGNISDIHSPTTMVTGLSPGENIFLWTIGNGSCESSDEVIITVKDLFVPSVITPNGDLKNEYFTIGEVTGKVELIIFNRWGSQEYKHNDYQNDWNGINIHGEKLPNDTYFYVLKFENGIIKKGSVLILR